MWRFCPIFRIFLFIPLCVKMEIGKPLLGGNMIKSFAVALACYGLVKVEKKILRFFFSLFWNERRNKTESKPANAKFYSPRQ